MRNTADIFLVGIKKNKTKQTHEQYEGTLFLPFVVVVDATVG